MSPRRRHPRKLSKEPGAPGYPSPAEREMIIERRDELMYKLIRLFVSGKAADDPAITKLVMEYGSQEVKRVTAIIQKASTRRDFLLDKPLIYREYRLAFARFGGQRRFLSKPEFEDLSYEHALLLGKRKFQTLSPGKPSRREIELRDLILSGMEFWEDITPSAMPARPVDFSAPPAGEYTGLEKGLLTLGWDLSLQRVRALAKKDESWESAVPDLERMVFDEGLLEGWPGESASWAPYHALHLLGYLKVHQVASQLKSLSKLENDWLSDQLPSVWAQMGEAVIPTLWDLVDEESLTPEQRGLAAAGLQRVAQTNKKQRAEIVQGFVQRLNTPPPYNAVVNAYIIFVLNRLHAKEARQAIASAFEQGKVDLDIIQPMDVEFLETESSWDDEEDSL